jgi:hypothetical protein
MEAFDMNKKLSRRTFLQVAISTGAGAATVARASYAEPPPSFQDSTHRRPASTDPYEDMLRRYGGEMGGCKPPR